MSKIESLRNIGIAASIAIGGVAVTSQESHAQDFYPISAPIYDPVRASFETNMINAARMAAYYDVVNRVNRMNVYSSADYTRATAFTLNVYSLEALRQEQLRHANADAVSRALLNMPNIRPAAPLPPGY
jgi:hypothetical protein